MVTIQNDSFLHHHARRSMKAPWWSPENRCRKESEDLEVLLVEVMLELKFENHQELLGGEKTLKAKGTARAQGQKHEARRQTQGALLWTDFSHLNSSIPAPGTT